MSTGAVLPAPKPSDKGSGLWGRLKKNLHLKDAGNGLVVQRRNPLDPRPMNVMDSMRRNRSQGDLYPDQYLHHIGNSSSAVSIGVLGRQNSFKNVQLQLANYDHENNLLNSKPVAKKLVAHTQTDSKKKEVLPQDFNGNRKQLRRALTMTNIGHERVPRDGSERSYSTHSSDHISYSSRSCISPASRSPMTENLTSGVIKHGTSKALWGKVRQQYAPTSVELGNAPPLPKLATFTHLWELIFGIVRDNEMLELDEPDPRLWWRKVFVNLRKRHGKGEDY